MIATLILVIMLQQPAPQQNPTGEQLYIEHCRICHAPTGHGTTLIRKRLGESGAVVETRANPSADLITTVVREGYRSMPAFRRAELTDDELKLMTDYLTSPDRRPQP